ncbi:winged helix-turn-helix domain-containing protein [Pseudomonas sp. 7P_10.2_Bac1]|uniref:winged helix-turn-helix domain-containing protein n=1 Tax=Pseudomonas sp. 7P_10.2_Bac1 TaxID=2971614 RepID=UPI0021C8CDC2|nr:winged helix-turn-helix domain-containing protein [Pseudomonas sp. 7P_10.2_Bac1]MCU1729603.1 winged helix-turn-helix domain-containing protein [Pseudomonas sp. 7P_10.2_Bac1]
MKVMHTAPEGKLPKSDTSSSKKPAPDFELTHSPRLDNLTQIINDNKIWLTAKGGNKKNSLDKLSLILNPLHSKNLNRVSVSDLPSPKINIPSTYSMSPQTWLFNFTTRELSKANVQIKLTIIESLLINTLTLSTERVCSKQELITGINKDSKNYSGLEMSLSRLQQKFRATFGERLFRSVRNRGYCLVQDVQIAQSSNTHSPLYVRKISENSN